MTELGEIQSEFRTSVEVELPHLVRWHDLISEMAEGGDISYRVDDAKAALSGLSKYIGKLVDVNEQDTP